MTTETDLLSSAANTGEVDPLQELVGEGKKFKDAAALAKAKKESDAFIEQLKAENAEMRAKMATSGTDQEAATKALIERIEKATGAKNPTTPGATLSKEEIEKLVRDGITVEQAAANRRANYSKANAELLNHFGGDEAKASAHLKERMSSLGMTGDSLTEIASSNPKMFRELFVPTPKASASGTAMPAGRQAPPTSGGERGKSYYDKLRKEMGRQFWDPSIQQQLFRDRKEMGSKFNTI